MGQSGAMFFRITQRQGQSWDSVQQALDISWVTLGRDPCPPLRAPCGPQSITATVKVERGEAKGSACFQGCLPRSGPQRQRWGWGPSRAPSDQAWGPTRTSKPGTGPGFRPLGVSPPPQKAGVGPGGLTEAAGPPHGLA